MLVGLVVALAHFGLELLKYFKIEPARLKLFFKNLGRGLASVIYTVIASVFSLFFLFAIITITRQPFQMGIVALDAIMALALLGLWAPIIQRSQNRIVEKVLTIIDIVLIIVAMAGFWVSQWPEWYVPTVLTVFLVILFIVYVIDKIVTQRKRLNGSPSQET